MRTTGVEVDAPRVVVAVGEMVRVPVFWNKTFPVPATTKSSEGVVVPTANLVMVVVVKVVVALTCNWPTIVAPWLTYKSVVVAVPVIWTPFGETRKISVDEE